MMLALIIPLGQGAGGHPDNTLPSIPGMPVAPGHLPAGQGGLGIWGGGNQPGNALPGSPPGFWGGAPIPGAPDQGLPGGGSGGSPGHLPAPPSGGSAGQLPSGGGGSAGQLPSGGGQGQQVIAYVPAYSQQHGWVWVPALGHLPQGGGGQVDNTLPTPSPGQPGHLPSPPGSGGERPDQGLPGGGERPGHLPSAGGPRPDQGLPRPPMTGERPDNTLPQPPTAQPKK